MSPLQCSSATPSWRVRSAAAVLAASNPEMFDDLITVLEQFYVSTDDIIIPGGNRGTIPIKLDDAFERLGWLPVRINTEFRLSGRVKGRSGAPILSSSYRHRTMSQINLASIRHLDFEPRQLCECARDPDDCINVAAVLLRTCSGSVWWFCWDCLAESRARPWLYCGHNRRHETHDEHFTLIGRK